MGKLFGVFQKLGKSADKPVESEVEESGLEVVSPANGELLDLSKVPDEVFSQRMMGDGFAIESEDGEICSPISGEIGMIFPTKHAIMIVRNELEVLVHMGLDTVNLGGEGFEVFCEVGQKIKAGDKLAKMDKNFIESKGYATITPIIFTNLEADKKVEISEGKIEKGEKERISVK